MNDKDEIFRKLSTMISTPASAEESVFDKEVMRRAMDAARESSIEMFHREYQTKNWRDQLKNAKLISEYSLESFNKNAVAEFVSAIDENDLIPKLVHDGYQAGAAGTYGMLPYSPYSDEGSSWMAGWLSGHIDYEQELFKRNERKKREYLAAQTSESTADKLSQEHMRAFFSQSVYAPDRTGEQKIAAGLNELLRSNKGKL